MKNQIRVLAGLLGIMTALSASAAESPAASVAAATTTTRSPLDSVYLNYFATYHGGPLSDLGSPYTVDRTGKPSSSAINFDSELTLAYLIDQNIGIGPVLPFVLSPVLGKGAILGDAGIKAFDRKTISGKGFNLYTNLILQAPTSPGSQARNMSFAVKTTPSVRYEFARSRFSTGAWTEAKWYAGVTNDKTFKLYGAPYVNYRLGSGFSLNLEYELEGHHNVGDAGATFSTYQADFQPGVVWFITPKIMINPYVQVFTTNSLTTDRAALGAVISATLL